MALDKIMSDDMNEVACAMLAYINEEDRQAGAKMSYGDFGKYLAQTYGKHYHGSNPNDCWIDSTPAKVMVTTSGGTKYELTWNKIAKFIHPYLKSTTVSETVETDTPTPAVNTPTDTAAFDYSAVDDDTAQYLRKATARIANSYADIGAVLAEAQERLANNKNGVFEKWYTFLGMKKSTVHDYIHIHKKRQELLISSEFRTISENSLEVFDSLPKTLQIDISSPSAPAEAVNAVLSGDITTHKDYIALKKRIEELEENIEDLEEECGELESQAADLGQKNDRLREENRIISRERLGAVTKNDELMKELKELRSRPVETVAIEKDPKESQEYKDMLSDYNKMHRQVVATTQENGRLKDRCDELSRRNTELKNQPQITGGFDSEQLRDFFEDYYSRANDAVRNLYQFIREGYPQDIRDYVRGRIDDLKDYIENLEAIHEEDFTV